MKLRILLLLIAGALCSCSPKGYNDGYIQYQQVKLTSEDKQILSESLKSQHQKYDPQIKMMTTTKSRRLPANCAMASSTNEVRYCICARTCAPMSLR